MALFQALRQFEIRRDGTPARFRRRRKKGQQPAASRHLQAAAACLRAQNQPVPIALRHPSAFPKAAESNKCGRAKRTKFRIPEKSLSGCLRLIQERMEARRQIRISNLTLPDHHDRPTCLTQCLQIARITGNRSLELSPPKIPVSGRCCCQNTTRMPVPKTPPDFNHLLPAQEDDVWPTWQFLQVQAVSISLSVEKAPDKHFRLRILSRYCSHISATRVADIDENRRW